MNRDLTRRHQPVSPRQWQERTEAVAKASDLLAAVSRDQDRRRAIILTLSATTSCTDGGDGEGGDGNGGDVGDNSDGAGTMNGAGGGGGGGNNY